MSDKELEVDYNKIESFAIFPPLNVARIGNSDDYYVGAEIPGVHVGEGDPSFEFKDDKQCVRPQAARFRIYGCDENGNVVREIKLTDKNNSVDVNIDWNVVLANKKAEHTQFQGINEYKPDGPKRNADWPYDRSTLMAISEQSLSSNDLKNTKIPTKEFKAQVYRTNDPKSGHELYLGKMILEQEGSLIIIGGKGKSGSIKEGCIVYLRIYRRFARINDSCYIVISTGAYITHYANNDYWYDDTSDGSIDANVTITVNKQSKKLKNREGKSWVLVAPPKYAPGIPNIVSLYQIIWETQHPNDHREVEYYRDIRPIFDAICRISWVNKQAFIGHGIYKPGHFLNPDMEKRLKDNSEQEESLRKGILARIRIPKAIASAAEYNGQAYDYFMPALSGNDGDVDASSPNTFFSVTSGQYLRLQKWAEGSFQVNEQNKPVKYFYQFDSKGRGRYPKYKNINGKSDKKEDYKEFEEIITEASLQVECLKKASLEWCVGGAFFPGIEMTFIAYNKETFDEHDFRINSKAIKPGDINAYMALPWQADFNECNTNWWPAQRPDVIITQKNLYEIMRRENNKIRANDFKEWTRGFRTDGGSVGAPLWGDMDMVRAWDRLGFVVEKEIDNGIKLFTEVEHDKVYKETTVKEIVENATLDDFYELLQLALQIELTTIPPYLYAMYSIKTGTEIGDKLKHLIRHVSEEEMLHAALVANLIVSIGRKPIFYSREAIPLYPNPLPHIKQGEIMVHLSKADVKTINTFIQIEAPDVQDKYPHSIPQKARNPLLRLGFLKMLGKEAGNVDSSEDDLDSIGNLYDAIAECFKKFNDQIKYDTKFQLEPGMGYAPSTGTGKDGLIIIDDLKAAEYAINLIKIQGEGSVSEFEASHYETFKKCLNLIKNASSEDYQLWPVITDPDKSMFPDSIVSIAKAFDAAYCYLMLMLQNVWRIENSQKKRDFVMGGLPAMMLGVLRPIAISLAKTPISADQHAGATFGYYEFTHGTSKPKQQLLNVVKASNLDGVLKVVQTLPDVILD
ncbi:13862_t:CDS:10 [Funneliformis mosseae]|uniref:13862_t:CDS:1 n=1 Tax=Funneliformis mosseae TaxID=27381 RepID=A0A9N9CRY8_FUNMO|nr:13862_t:CDS:10 [Funneliformis mosseae]